MCACVCLFICAPACVSACLHACIIPARPPARQPDSPLDCVACERASERVHARAHTCTRQMHILSRYRTEAWSAFCRSVRSTDLHDAADAASAAVLRRSRVIHGEPESNECGWRNFVLRGQKCSRITAWRRGNLPTCGRACRSFGFSRQRQGRTVHSVIYSLTEARGR